MILMPDDEDVVRACVVHDPAMQWELIHVSLVTVRHDVTWSCSGQNRPDEFPVLAAIASASASGGADVGCGSGIVFVIIGLPSR